MSITEIDSGWFDSHCHLNDMPNWEAACHIARQHNIGQFVVPGTEPKQWPEVLAVSGPGCFHALGIHPWYVSDIQSQVSALEQNLSSNQVFAVGEIGLDFYLSHSPRPERSLQIEAFELQLQLANQFSLPVIVHSVKAHNETLAILKAKASKGVVHAFSAHWKVAKQYLEQGFYLGIGPQLLRSKKLQEAVIQIPMDSILLETDAPYMNMPGTENPLLPIIEVGRLISELKGVTLDYMQAQTRNNANRLFNLEGRAA